MKTSDVCAEYPPHGGSGGYKLVGGARRARRSEEALSWIGALDGGCVSAARLDVVDLSKLDLRSYAGAEHADAAWARPSHPSRRLGPRKAAVRTIWSER